MRCGQGQSQLSGYGHLGGHAQLGVFLGIFDDDGTVETASALEDILEECMWTAERLDQDFDNLLNSNYVSLLLEHKVHIHSLPSDTPYSVYLFPQWILTCGSVHFNFITHINAFFSTFPTVLILVVVANGVSHLTLILSLLSLAVLTHLLDGLALDDLALVMIAIISNTWLPHTGIEFSSVIGLSAFAGLAGLSAWKDVLGVNVWPFSDSCT
jgi:hypothetical protein